MAPGIRAALVLSLLLLAGCDEPVVTPTGPAVPNGSAPRPPRAIPTTIVTVRDLRSAAAVPTEPTQLVPDRVFRQVPVQLPTAASTSIPTATLASPFAPEPVPPTRPPPTAVPTQPPAPPSAASPSQPAYPIPGGSTALADTGAASPTPTVEYKLAVVQSGGYVGPNDPLVGQLARALDDLAPRCQEDRQTLADMAVRLSQLLAGRGVQETPLSILVNGAGAVPIVPGKTTCADAMAAYGVLRTPR